MSLNNQLTKTSSDNLPPKPQRPLEPKQNSNPGYVTQLLAVVGTAGLIMCEVSIGYVILYCILVVIGSYVLEVLAPYSIKKAQYHKDLDLYIISERKYQADLKALQNQQKTKICENPVLLIEPTLRDVEVLSVEKVRNGNNEFIAINAREGSTPISVSCSLEKYEKMGIADKLPLNFKGGLNATIGIVEIPDDGNTYGYKNKAGDVIAYQRQGRFQLTNVYKAYATGPDVDFRIVFGKDYDAATASADERAFYEQLELTLTATDWLRNKGVKYLYHFTDKRNVELIKRRGGLYSWYYLEKNNLNIPKPGGNDGSRMLDKHHKLENYVRTSICKNHPMAHVAKKEGRIGDFQVLKIDLDAIENSKVIFTNMNATDNNHKRNRTIEVLKEIDFRIFGKEYYDLKDEKNKKHYQAEVMFEKYIPIKYIKFY